MASVASAPAAVLTAVTGLPTPDSLLPVLEPVKSREQYRERPEGETEEAVWYSAEEQDTLVEPQQVRLRSIHSKQAAVIVFSNKSTYRVRALWIDFKGNEVAYSVLEPGATKRYHTYVTHPWIVRELNSATRMMLSGRPSVVGASTEQTVEIQAPPRLEWSLSTHPCFPKSYKTAVRGLLLAHKALERYATTTDALPSPDAFATVAPLISPRKRTASPRTSFDNLELADAALCPSASKRVCSVSPSIPPASPAGPKAYSATAAVTPRSTLTTTSISFSSEAAHFTATLTVSSPIRANMKSTVNIEVADLGGYSRRTTVNFDTVMTDAADDSQTEMAVAPAGSIDQLLPASAGSSSKASPVAKKSGCGLLSMLKMCAAPTTASPRNMLKSWLGRPKALNLNTITSVPGKTGAVPTAMDLDVQAPAGTSLTVQVQQQCEGMFVDADNSSCSGPAAPVCCWPPTDTHLGNLPSHLLVYIAELAAPVTWQSLSAPALGRPDIKPTLMACPPITAEEQQQMDEQEQQQQQQQAGNNQA